MEEEPVELSEEIDLSRDDLETEEEVEIDSTDLLADEPEENDDEDDFNELEMLMDPYELNDY